jgi:hypothetical protein
MSKSTRIRLCDIRNVYRLLSEIVEMGDDPEQWRPHLAMSLLRMFDLQMATVFVMPLPLDTSHCDVGRISLCGLDEAGNRAWLEYGARGDLSCDPCTPSIEARSGCSFAASRQMLAEDREWYRSDYYNGFRRLTRSDDLVVSLLPMPDVGILHGISGDRSRGAPPIGRREVVCVGLIHKELERKWRLLLSRPALVEKTLPPRLRELLRHLRGPDTESQIAHHMHLSPHTVHNHVRRLYARFGVRSREELRLADNKRFIGVPRLGVAGL